MGQARQLILTPGGGESSDAERGGLGLKREVLRLLGEFNTAPDGSAEGFGVAHGPGFLVELPLVDEKDEVKQVMVSVLDEETAWPVLARMCMRHHWQMVDPVSGRSFGGGGSG